MKRIMFRALAALAATAAMVSGAYATPISPSPTVTVGSLTFSDFETTISGMGQYSPTDASAISVQGLTTGDPGIEITGGFNAFGSGSFGDVSLDYTVAASGTSIEDIFLGLSGASLAGAGANVNVIECAYADAAHTMLLGGSCLDVYDPPPTLTDELSLGGAYSTVYVTKDIYYSAGTCGADCSTHAGLSIIDQRFSLTSNVPEPGTLALFGAGLLGCAIFVGRRRRRDSQSRD